MRMKLLVVLFALGGLAVVGTACSSTPAASDNDAAAAKHDYIDDDTLEAFDKDFRALSQAISRANVGEERALRTKISESARLYQKALISALYDDSSTPRRKLAAVMLGFTGDASVVSPLVQKVNDYDEPESVRLNAVLGLATLGDKLRDYKNHKELMRAFSNEIQSKEASFGMRRASIMAYAVAYDGAQNDSIMPLLDAFRSDGDMRVQVAAVNAMGDIGDTTAVPDLTVIGLKYPEVDIRAASAVALGKIADPTRVIPALAGACEDSDALVRRQAIDGISKQYGSDPERVFAVILTGLSDFNAQVREAAALALARIDDVRAIDSLLQATGDRTAIVRRAAAESLGKLITPDREKEAFPLVGMLADQDPGVKSSALSSLTFITKKDFGGEQPRWQQYFYKKYPDLDPANMYAGGPKPRISSGISSSGTRRTTTTPRYTPSRTRTNSSSRYSNRNSSRRINNSRLNGRRGG